MYASFWPSIRDSPEMEQLVENYPQGAKAFLGDLEGFTTPAGYLKAESFAATSPILLLVFALGRAVAAIAGEEDRRTLEVLLSFPLTRRRVAIEKAAALVASLGILLLVFATVTLLGVQLYDMGIPAGSVAGATALLGLLVLLFAALAFAVGAATGRPPLAYAVAIGTAAATWIVNGLGKLAPPLEPLRSLSPWTHYEEADALVQGFPLGTGAAFGATALLLLAIGVLLFERRDVGVA